VDTTKINIIFSGSNFKQKNFYKRRERREEKLIGKSKK
jgi:hypothetical protein